MCHFLLFVLLLIIILKFFSGKKWRGKRRIIEQEGRSGLSVSFSIFKPMPRIAGLSRLFSQAALFLYFLMPMCPREVFHIRKEFLKMKKEAPGGFLIQTPKNVTVPWKNEMNFGSFWTLSLSHWVPWTGRDFLPCILFPSMWRRNLLHLPTNSQITN